MSRSRSDEMARQEQWSIFKHDATKVAGAISSTMVTADLQREAMEVRLQADLMEIVSKLLHLELARRNADEDQEFYFLTSLEDSLGGIDAPALDLLERLKGYRKQVA